MNYVALLAEIARELGYERLWTTLTTTLDEQLAAVCDAGSRTRQELPAALREKLARIETTLASCDEQLRAAANDDLLAVLLLQHSRLGQEPETTLAQRFETARRLRQMAEKWEAQKSECAATARHVAESLEGELDCHLYLDHESVDALAGQVCDLGGVVIPTRWQGWPFPRLSPPLPRGQTKSPAEIQAQLAREDRSHEGWQQAIVDRICSPPHSQLSFWFPQVVPEEELSLPENRVNGGFAGLFTADEWPVLQLQVESPPNVVKRPSILSCDATYQAFRCRWMEEDSTSETKEDFLDRLTILRGFFVQLHQWCRENLVPLGEFTFCGPKIWENDERFRHDWEHA